MHEIKSANSKAGIGLLNRGRTIASSSRQCADGIYRLRDDDRLVVDHVGVEKFISLYPEHVIRDELPNASSTSSFFASRVICTAQ